MNEVVMTAPWALMTFGLGAFTGLVALIAYFARLGSRVSGVEKKLVELRDEMRAGFAEVRAGFAEVNKNLSRIGERVAKTEGRVDGWFEARNVHDDEKPESEE